MSRKLLILNTQSPFDPTSGAAQSTRLVGECLALSGYSVRSLSTTACEGSLADFSSTLPSESRKNSSETFEFTHKRIEYVLCDVSPSRIRSLEDDVGPFLDQRLEQLLAEWKPDLVLTYGGNAADKRRRAMARISDARVVFALHNRAYLKHPQSDVDAYLSPTGYLTSQYAKTLSSPILTVAPPLDPDRVANRPFAPSLITFVNPEPAKGAILVAQLIKRLARSHPEQAVLVVGGRVPAGALLKVGRDVGIDLSDCANLYSLPPTQDIGEILAETKILLMPSVVNEAAGRMALEAMLNGSIALVSNRAGLAEVVGDTGVKLPAPPATAGNPKRVPSAIVDAWHRAICIYLDDEERRIAKSVASKIHAQALTVESLAPAYKAVFDAI